MKGNINLQKEAAGLMLFNLMEGKYTLRLYQHRDKEREREREEHRRIRHRARLYAYMFARV